MSRSVLVCVLLVLCVVVCHCEGIERRRSKTIECGEAPQVALDRRKEGGEKGRLRVATFNVEWLFDGIDDQSIPLPWKSPDDALEHIKAVAKTIKGLDADIVNLVEVESCQVLKTLVALLPEMGYVPYLIESGDTATRQTLGLLTRIDPVESLKRTETRVQIPIKSSACKHETEIPKPSGGGYGRKSKTTAVTKHYRVKFLVGSKKILLIGVHLRRMADQFTCQQREGQALLIRGLVEHAVKEDPEAEVIVTGDFNDMDDDVVVRLLKSISDPRDPKQAFLRSVAERLPTDSLYSWQLKQFDGVGTPPKSLIDHMLVSRSLFSVMSNVFVDHSRENPQVESDHFPLVATFISPDLAKPSGTAPISSERTDSTTPGSETPSSSGTSWWPVYLVIALVIIIYLISDLVVSACCRVRSSMTRMMRPPSV